MLLSKTQNFLFFESGKIIKPILFVQIHYRPESRFLLQNLVYTKPIVQNVQWVFYFKKIGDGNGRVKAHMRPAFVLDFCLEGAIIKGNNCSFCGLSLKGTVCRRRFRCVKTLRVGQKEIAGNLRNFYGQ